MPADKAKVACGIPGCGSSVVNLNRHCKQCHPNLDPKKDKRIKGSGFAPGEKFASWCKESSVSTEVVRMNANQQILIMCHGC